MNKCTYCKEEIEQGSTYKSIDAHVRCFHLEYIKREELIKKIEGGKVPLDKMKHDLQCKCDFEKNKVIQDIIANLKNE